MVGTAEKNVTFAGYTATEASGMDLVTMASPLAYLDARCMNAFGTQSRAALSTELVQGSIVGLPASPADAPAAWDSGSGVVVSCASRSKCLGTSNPHTGVPDGWGMSLNYRNHMTWPSSHEDFEPCNNWCEQVICVLDEATRTLTSTSTSMLSTTTGLCMTSPVVLNGHTPATCVGQSSGSTCSATCTPGYSWRGGDIVCRSWGYRVGGACVMDGEIAADTQFDVVQASAVTVLVRNSAASAGAASLDADWASSHLAVILRAVSRVLMVSESLLRLEILHEASDGSAMFSMRVVVVLDAGGLPADFSPSSPEQVSLWIQESFVAGSTRSLRAAMPDGRRMTQNGLLAQIIAALDEEGDTVPSDLYTAVTEVQGMQEVPEFYLVLPQWVVGPFEDCPSACGETHAIRRVGCTSGTSSHCLLRPEVVGPEPLDRQACYSYASCPWYYHAMCPFGPGVDGGFVDGGCSFQNAAVLAPMCLFICACLGCIFIFCRRFSRPVEHGKKKLDHVVAAGGGSKVQYFIKRPQLRDELANGITTSAGDIITNRSANNTAKLFNKTQIVWDIDMAKSIAMVKAWNKDGVPVQYEDDGDAENFEFEGADALPPPGSNPDRWLDPMTKRFQFPVYASGLSIEYYSSSHHKWVPGIVAVTRNTESRFVYNVVLGNEAARRVQHRMDVPVQAIRLPLVAGEAVEVATKHGLLDGEVLRRNAILSNITYSVAHEVPGNVEPHEAQVHSTLLQRRYPPGSDVEVYRGPDIGWALATVMKSASHTIDKELTDDALNSRHHELAAQSIFEYHAGDAFHIVPKAVGADSGETLLYDHTRKSCTEEAEIHPCKDVSVMKVDNEEKTMNATVQRTLTMTRTASCLIRPFVPHGRTLTVAVAEPREGTDPVAEEVPFYLVRRKQRSQAGYPQSHHHIVQQATIERAARKYEEGKAFSSVSILWGPPVEVEERSPADAESNPDDFFV